MKKKVTKKVKLVSLLVGTAALVGIHPSVAMEDEIKYEGPQQTGVKQKSQLALELEKVKAFIETNKSKNIPTTLVLGACNNEENLNRFPETTVFFDMSTQDSEGRPYLTADFDDLEQLKEIKQVVDSSFSRIVMDDSTFKFTNWTIPHLQEFKNMLTEGGQFIFTSGQLNMMENLEKENLSDDQTLQFFKENNVFEPGILPTGYVAIHSLNLSVSEKDLNNPEVQARLERYLSLKEYVDALSPEQQKALDNLRSSEFGEYGKKAQELGLQKYPDHSQLSNLDNLRPSIAKTLKTERLNKQFKRETLLPYMKRFLEQVFPHVDLQLDAPTYPIGSNFSEGPFIIFTATK
jgi:hypothetical protein